MKILVVDDDTMERRVVTRLGRMGGHEVVPVSSGEAAVSLVAAADFDLVVMDIRMPGIDGLEAARRIRALGGLRAELPIIAMSGAHLGEATCREAGFNRFVLKDHITLELMLNEVAVARTITAESGGPPEHEDAVTVTDSKTEGSKDHLQVPKMVAWGIVIPVAAALFGGTWYMATQAATIRFGTEAATARTKEITDHQTVQDAAIKANSDALLKLEHDQGTLLGDMVGRLIKIESKIDYYAPPPPRR